MASIEWDIERCHSFRFTQPCPLRETRSEYERRREGTPIITGRSLLPDNVYFTRQREAANGNVSTACRLGNPEHVSDLASFGELASLKLVDGKSNDASRSALTAHEESLDEFIGRFVSHTFGWHRQRARASTSIPTCSRRHSPRPSRRAPRRFGASASNTSQRRKQPIRRSTADPSSSRADTA